MKLRMDDETDHSGGVRRLRRTEQLAQFGYIKICIVSVALPSSIKL